MKDKSSIQSMIDKASNLEIELVWIPKIMAKQTFEEKNMNHTIEANKKGLSMCDAPFITDIYDHIKSGSHITENQAIASKKILRKYWKQYSKMMTQHAAGLG